MRATCAALSPADAAGSARPRSESAEASSSPNWHHATVGYAVRLSGYTSRAIFDLSASAGVSVDFLGQREGISETGWRTRTAPYVAVNAAFWQDGPAGLLFHAGQTFPLSPSRADVRMTDLRMEVRLDLSTAMSIHVGYCLLLVHRPGESRPASEIEPDPLDGQMSGPFVGLDVRF